MRLKKSRANILFWFLCGCTGIAAGTGLFTFVYARGFSYASNDPLVCTNCHVMIEQYRSWSKSSHHAVATCNDCHVPRDFPGNYLAKARNGWNHSKAFTLQDFPEPIRITPTNQAILQQNCIACHQGMTNNITGPGRAAAGRCIGCHRSVGHLALD